ncbi:hypothetical protein AMD27_00945 [Acinetobacter sp. TGL-Y2]|uniref:hypothetical protein n=1 Tax=Acinetobacter sp. TGL-Y2 TaxID=1407071 RepID=UPI0007A673E4|nr:hypothetical protein [Acinetobacter sp. TGL-Y2]AMW77606.1 hypothetical protein AMD27_00945 [Acinetobacter sp. TGL-Y2]
MDLIQHVSERISALKAGEIVTISVQDLLISRTDFQAITVFLNQLSQNGLFSVAAPLASSSRFEQTSLTITKY